MSIKYKFHDQWSDYFVTFSVVEWVDVFTRDEYRQIVTDSLNFCIKNKGLIVRGWVLMSNHIHLVITLKDDTGPRLADIMRDLKKYTAMQIIKRIKENPAESRRGWMLDIFLKAGASNSQNTNYQFWRHDNHPLILDNDKKYINALYYIHQNPVRAGWVAEAAHYIWSSACDYGNKKGLVDIEMY